MGMHLLNKLWPRDVCSIMLSEKHLSTTASQKCLPRLLHILYTQREDPVMFGRFGLIQTADMLTCGWDMQSRSFQPPLTSKDVLQICLYMNLLLLFMTLIGVSQTKHLHSWIGFVDWFSNPVFSLLQNDPYSHHSATRGLQEACVFCLLCLSFRPMYL